jgi:amidase
MRAAGAIPIGRTNLPTYALRWHTDGELWGETINRWDRTRTRAPPAAGRRSRSPPA